MRAERGGIVSSGGGARWRELVLAGLLGGCALLLPGSVRAAIIHIGGIDQNSQYTKPDPLDEEAQDDAGIFTFDDQFNGFNDPERGLVTSCEDAGGTACTDFGLDLLSENDLGESVPSVDFDVVLSATQENGIDPFDPATDNINKATFEGLSGASDFVIWDPNGSGNILLQFNVVFIDVTQATPRQAVGPIVLDPDGQINLGNADPLAVSSLLTVSGGTLNQLVGGKGTPARLQLQMGTLDPAILNSAALSGYFDDNFLSGFSSSTPRNDTTWNLTIVPEPSTAALMGVSLIGLVGLARRYSRPR